MNNNPAPKKSGDVPTGAVGMALTLIFCIWIGIFPGRDHAVFFGGVVSLVGLVISILGIAKNSGRLAGAAGVALFFVGWAINTIAVGHL